MKSDRPYFRVKPRYRKKPRPGANSRIELSLEPSDEPYELPGHPQECDCPLCERELLTRAARTESEVEDGGRR